MINELEQVSREENEVGEGSARQAEVCFACFAASREQIGFPSSPREAAQP